MGDSPNGPQAVDDLWSIPAPKKSKKPVASGFDFGNFASNEVNSGVQLEAQPAEGDPWGDFGLSKKGKMKKNRAVCSSSPVLEQPAAAGVTNGTWGDSWNTDKWGFTNPAVNALETADDASGKECGPSSEGEPALQSAADGDWSAFLTPKEKKSKKRRVPEFGDMDQIRPEPAQPVEKTKTDSEPSVKADVNEPGHGPVGSCTCERCLDDARLKVEEQLKEPSWTSNYISKLQARISHLEAQNENMGRSSRHYSSYPSSIASLADEDESPIVTLPSHAAPCSEGVIVDGPTNNAQKETALKVDIKRRRKIEQRYGEHKIERDDDTMVGDLGQQSSSNDYVLTVYREFDKKKHFWRRYVEIVSPSFMEVLRESPYDIELRLTEDRLVVYEPFMTLFHNRGTLNQYIEKGGYASDTDEVRQAKSHTQLVLDFMRKELSESKVLDEIESATPSGLIEFPNIWMLYPPGTTIYSKWNGEYEAFIVDSVRGVRKSMRHKSGQHTYSRLELTCWSIDYDGEIFGRVWSTHEIFPFKGSKEISSLQVVPEKFLPDAENVKSSLTTRGKEFWALQGQNYREYHGEIWSQHMSEDATRIMVDHLTYQRRENWPISIDNKHGPSEAQSKNWRENRFGNGYRTTSPVVYDDYPHGRRARRAPPPSIDYDEERAYSPERACDRDDYYEGYYERKACERPPQRANSKLKQYDVIQPCSQPDNLALLLCPQQIHGYCLRDKVWKNLNVNQLKPVRFRKNAWDRLVLDPDYKDILQAMVSSYVDKTAGIEDLVAGKGAGLVALLHGPPGTGKTLTAECVADSFEKPLYQVTCGDIGTHPSDLENRLEEIFEYAVTWGAILLLDEADVFLQERDQFDIQRNALVSVFLRTLEYFNGILFLTTNRIGTFDQAFQSRVHVTLGLPSLDRPRRTEVWSIFLEDLARKSLLNTSERETFEALVRDEWSKENLNGRQIRNAVRTAMLVAEKKKEAPSKAHFDTVLKIGRDFERYMSALKIGEPDAVAEKKGERLAGVEGFYEVQPDDSVQML